MFIHVDLRPIFCLLGALAVQNPMPDDLKSSVEGLIRESGAASVGVAVRDLQTGRELFINPDETFHAASTMKVPVMVELYRQDSARKLRLRDRLPITNSFKSIADGAAFTLSAEDD